VRQKVEPRLIALFWYLAAGTRILAPIADIAITIAAISTSISPENSCSLAFSWSHLDDYCGITSIPQMKK